MTLPIPHAAADLHRQSLVVDLHTHGPRFVPQPFRTLHRLTNPRRPPEAGFDVMRRAGVDTVVAKAVGDPIVTRWYRRTTPWTAVDAQLSLCERQAVEARVRLVTSADDVAAAHADGVPAMVLGVEGADALGGDVDRVNAWQGRGVRVVVLVHLGDNDLGTTCLPWQQYVGPVPVRRRAEPGLTPFGQRVVQRMNEVGIAVDVAHADGATLTGVIDVATAPVISSHSGARALQDFPRYLTDGELDAIASTGGVIGLWPFRTRRHGVREVADLVAHARHIAERVGADHIGIGTDMNGVPGLMEGYTGEADLPTVTAALLDGGFTSDEVRRILGGNALRVLRSVEAAATRHS